MNAFASFKFDPEYFEACYRNTVLYRLRWRRHAILIMAGFVLAAAIAWWSLPSDRSILGVLCFASILGLFNAITHKSRWLRDRLASVAEGKTAEITFTDDRLHLVTPNSEGSLAYAVFSAVSITPGGIFLIPEAGVSMFVPKTAFANPDDFDPVCSLLMEHLPDNTPWAGTSARPPFPDNEFIDRTNS